MSHPTIPDMLSRMKEAGVNERRAIFMIHGGFTKLNEKGNKFTDYAAWLNQSMLDASSSAKSGVTKKRKEIDIVSHKAFNLWLLNRLKAERKKENAEAKAETSAES